MNPHLTRPRPTPTPNHQPSTPDAPPTTHTHRFTLRPALLRIRHLTCQTPDCTRRGYDIWPTLRTCPGCGRPTTPIRRWLR
jgi:hypothetical protein